MAFEQKNGRGIIFDNKNKKINPHQPDWSGNLKFNEVDYKIVAWEVNLDIEDEITDNKVYFSIKLTPSVEQAFANDNGDDFDDDTQANNFGFKMLRNTGVLFYNPVQNSDKPNSPDIIGELNLSGNIEKIYGYEKISKNQNKFCNLLILSQLSKEKEENKQRHAEQEYVKQQILHLQNKHNNEIEALNIKENASNEILNDEELEILSNIFDSQELLNDSQEPLNNLPQDDSNQNNIVNNENTNNENKTSFLFSKPAVAGSAVAGSLNNKAINLTFDEVIQTPTNDVELFSEHENVVIKLDNEMVENTIEEIQPISNQKIVFNIDNLGDPLDELNSLISELSNKNI